ncbi:MAG: asparagine synthase (glutamine-hydrolyzing) [Bacteroidia bacterium]|jgi:asparagine synthase (glutamine-hydrolysing)|nr:asparagine synthase (glutamine-hydrolyzing) [Bacteroidia bacterium]
MCGITGIITLSRHAANLTGAAQAMNTAIAHRGPDGEGFLAVDEHGNATALYGNDTPQALCHLPHPHSPQQHIAQFATTPRFVFGHRRLAIIDITAAGHQPLCTADKQLWITYNGELYNYIELRAELEQNGAQFHTHTDTEVVLEAYRTWGENCLTRFNGMFAFVIWDRAKQQLFAARDRFGVKPFYYYHDADVFCFASEQKALRKNSLVKTALRHEAVADYFAGSEIEHQPESFFANILELFPGCALSLNLQSNQLKQWTWYSLNINQQFATPAPDRFEAHVQLVRERLYEAIRLRMRSDVPVGACLSGGIDSSAIAGIMADVVSTHGNVNVGEKLKLFTAVFDDARIDERRWAQEVVHRTKAEWHTVQPEPHELLADLEELIYSQDVPIWSTSTYAQHRVMKLAAQNGIRVLLDGQGGDELFAGYHPYFRAFWSELLGHGEWGTLRSEMKQFDGPALKFWLREHLKQRTVPALPNALRKKLMQRWYREFRYLNPELISSYVQRRNPHTGKHLNEMLRGEFVNTRLKGYLKCEDRCSMWHSVESRTPFADDHLLIETVFALPGSMKIRHGYTKALLREAAAPWLPETIRTRRDKLGYATPNNQWITTLRHELRPYFEQNFDGIFNKELLLKEYDSLFSPQGETDTGRVFKFIAFAVWRKVHNL